MVRAKEIQLARITPPLSTREYILINWWKRQRNARFNVELYERVLKAKSRKLSE